MIFREIDPFTQQSCSQKHWKKSMTISLTIERKQHYTLSSTVLVSKLNHKSTPSTARLLVLFVYVCWIIIQRWPTSDRYSPLVRRRASIQSAKRDKQHNHFAMLMHAHAKQSADSNASTAQLQTNVQWITVESCMMTKTALTAATGELIMLLLIPSPLTCLFVLTLYHCNTNHNTFVNQTWPCIIHPY